MYWRPIPSQRVRGTRPCNRGSDCYFLKKGQCWFYHPSEDSSSRNYSSFGYSRFREQQTSQSIFERLRKIKIEKEEAEQEEREKQRRRKLQRERQQREREEQEREQRERQRIRQNRLRLLMQNFRAQKKQQTPKFQWYFSKNKSFKALEISQEKLQDLDQCIICFESFWSHEDNSYQACNPEIKHSFQESGNLEGKSETKFNLNSKQLLEKDLTELYCKHTFHKECIQKWLLTNPKCPVCRKNFREHEEYRKYEEELRVEKKKDEKKPELRHSLSQSSLNSSWLFQLLGDLRL